MELRIGDKRGNYTLEQLIFVRPDGSSRAVKLKLSNRPSFNAVFNQINTVLEEEYKITQQLVENRSAEFNLGFYNEKENERYSWRVGGINDIQSQHKIKDLKWLFKGKGDTYLTGFKKEGIKIIGDLLQESSIMGIYWEGNKACAYHSSYSSSSLSMDSSQENTAKGGIDLTALPITTQSVLNQPLTANIPIASSALNLNINLDNELKQIQNMVNAGIIPSGERIREYALASSSLQKEEGYAQERVGNSPNDTKNNNGGSVEKFFFCQKTNFLYFPKPLINCCYRKGILYRSKRIVGVILDSENPPHSKTAIISFSIRKSYSLPVVNFMYFLSFKDHVIIFGLF